MAKFIRVTFYFGKSAKHNEERLVNLSFVEHITFGEEGGTPEYHLYGKTELGTFDQIYLGTVFSLDGIVEDE